MGPCRMGLGRDDLIILWGWHLSSLRHDAHGLFLDGGAHLRNIDGALLELLSELLVQEITDDQDGNHRHDVEDVKWTLSLYLVNNRALRVIDNWNCRLHY